MGYKIFTSNIAVALQVSYKTHLTFHIELMFKYSNV